MPNDTGPFLCHYRFQRGDRFYTSESDVCRRQILTYKNDPITEIIKIFIMAPNIGIQMMIANGRKPFGLHGLYKDKG